MRTEEQLIESPDHAKRLRYRATFLLLAILIGAILGATCRACQCLITGDVAGDALLECVCTRALKSGLVFALSIIVLLKMGANERLAYTISSSVLVIMAVEDAPFFSIAVFTFATASVYAVFYRK